jgi:hypothetical protein
VEQLLATYTLRGECHRIEIVPVRRGTLLLDRPSHGTTLVVAELSRDEGEEQALAVLNAGGYLERARGGEPHLCRPLRNDDLRLGERQLAQAA